MAQTLLPAGGVVAVEPPQTQAPVPLDLSRAVAVEEVRLPTQGVASVETPQVELPAGMQLVETTPEGIQIRERGRDPNLGQQIVPTAARVGLPLAGAAIGSIAGPAGALAGGAVGGGIGEYIAERIEADQGTRTDVNPAQVATQAAIGLIPGGRLVKPGTAALKILGRRALEGAGIGAAADVATQLAEGEGLNAPNPAAVVLGGLFGGGIGAAEARATRRLASAGRPVREVAPLQPPTVRQGTVRLNMDQVAWAQPPGADAPVPTPGPQFQQATRVGQAQVSPTSIPIRERLQSLVKDQTAPRPTVSVLDRAREEAGRVTDHFVNEAAELDRFLREGGYDPLRETADAGNPSKLLDIAKGGASGRAQRLAIEMDRLLAAARKDGVDNALSEYLNIEQLEHGLRTLEPKAAAEAMERTMAERARAVGRQPKQLQLLKKADEPPDAIGRQVAEEQAARQAELDAQGPRPDPLSVNTATATAVGRAPMRTIGVARGTARTDDIRMVPLEDPGPQPRGPRAKKPTPEELAQAERARIGSDAPLPDGSNPSQPALFDDLADESGEAVTRSTGQEEWFIPEQSPLPKYSRQPRPEQRELTTPTNREAAAINALVEHAKLGEVRTRTTTKRVYPQIKGEAIEEIARDLDVSVDHVRAFVRAAERKGGLPEWLIRSEIADARRRGGWEATVATKSDIGRRLAEGKALPRSFTPDDVRALREDWNTRTDLTPEQKRAVEGVASRVFLLNQRALDEAIDAGLITREVADDLRQRAWTSAATGGGGYSPMLRVMDELTEHVRGVSRGVELPSQHLLYKMNGSARDTEHPLQSSLLKGAVAISEAEKNKALQALVRLRGRNAFFADNIRPLKGNDAAPEGFGVISVFEDGKPVRYAVPEPLADVYKAADPVTADWLEKLWQATHRVFRAGTTTANIPFAVGNVPRDVSFATATTAPSKAQILAGVLNPMVWRRFARAAGQVLRQSPEYLQYLDSGAAFSGLQANMKEIDEVLKLRSLQKRTPLQWAGAVLKSPLTGASKFNSTLEDATKVMAHQRLLEQGLGPKEAAWQTRRFGGSPDYARRGDMMQKINTIFPFANAGIQGFVRAATYARLHPDRAATAAMGAFGRLAMLHAYNHSWTDPDGTRSWDRISDREKEDNWIILLPGTFSDPETGVERRNYAKIPVAHEINLLRAPLQAMLDPRTRNVEDVANTIGGSMPLSPQVSFDQPVRSLRNTVVSAANPLVRVPAELWANEDTFRGTPIVSRRLEGVEPREQFTARTSPTAVAIGQAVNQSPANIEHSLRGFLGGVGTAALDAVDPLFGDKDQKPVTDVPGLREVTDLPGVSGVTRAIVRRVAGGPSSIDAVLHRKKERFYDVLNDTKTAADTWRKLRADLQAPSQATRERAAERMREIMADERQMLKIRMYGRLNTLSQRVSAMRRAEQYQGEAEMFDQIDQMLTALNLGVK